MVRRRSGRIHIRDADTAPNLKFEHFNPNKGNSPDAVVYLPDDNAMLYMGRHYKGSYDFPSTAIVTEAFKVTENLLVVKTKSSNNDDPDDDEDTQYLFNYMVIPNAEQKTQLTALMQQHGKDLNAELAELLKGVERVKTLVHEYGSQMDDICPGYDVERHLYFEKIPSSALEMKAVGLVEATLDELVRGSEMLETAEPYSRKRKAED